jgi:hypothetical protein
MADDVSIFRKHANCSANDEFHSLGPYSPLPSKTKILPRVTTARPQIAGAPTRTTRALTKTSRPTRSLKLARNSTRITKAVAQTVMLRWGMRMRMRIAMLPRRQQYQNARRRSKKHRNDDGSSTPLQERGKSLPEGFSTLKVSRNFSDASNIVWNIRSRCMHVSSHLPADNAQGARCLSLFKRPWSRLRQAQEGRWRWRGDRKNQSGSEQGVGSIAPEKH